MGTYNTLKKIRSYKLLSYNPYFEGLVKPPFVPMFFWGSKRVADPKKRLGEPPDTRPGVRESWEWLVNLPPLRSSPPPEIRADYVSIGFPYIIGPH